MRDNAVSRRQLSCLLFLTCYLHVCTCTWGEADAGASLQCSSWLGQLLLSDEKRSKRHTGCNYCRSWKTRLLHLNTHSTGKGYPNILGPVWALVCPVIRLNWAKWQLHPRYPTVVWEQGGVRCIHIGWRVYLWTEGQAWVFGIWHSK